MHTHTRRQRGISALPPHRKVAGTSALFSPLQLDLSLLQLRILQNTRCHSHPPVAALRRHVAGRIASQLPTRGNDIHDLVSQDAHAPRRETKADRAHVFPEGGVTNPPQRSDQLEGEGVARAAARGGRDVQPRPSDECFRPDAQQSRWHPAFLSLARGCDKRCRPLPFHFGAPPRRQPARGRGN